MALSQIKYTNSHSTSGIWFTGALFLFSTQFKGVIHVPATHSIFSLPHLTSYNINSTLHVIEVRRERKKDAITPLTGLLPIFITWIFVALYLYQQPIILEQHLIPFTFYIGLINAYSVGQIITAHLTKNPEFPMRNILVLPLGLAVLDSLGPTLGLWPSVLGSGTYQIAFMFSCLGLAVGVYGSFIVSPLFPFGPFFESHMSSNFY